MNAPRLASAALAFVMSAGLLAWASPSADAASPPVTFFTQRPNTWDPFSTTDFAFYAVTSAGPATFRCKLDAGLWHSCVSPVHLTGLVDGLHTFYVRAYDANGQAELEPASVQWRVDTTGPTLTSVVLNGGKKYTNSSIVSADLVATDQTGAEWLAVATSNVLNSSGWLEGSNGYDTFVSPRLVDVTNPDIGGNSNEGTKVLYFQAGDSLGNWGPVKSASIVYDRTPPALSAPTMSLTPGDMSGTQLRVRISWSATDAISGVAAYELQQSHDGYGWIDVTPSPNTTHVVDHFLESGHVWQYRVRARDVAGNWTAWVTGQAFRPTIRQESSSGITYTGSWSTVASTYSWGASVKRSKIAGSTATTTFTGTTIGWASTKGPGFGQARIYVDGVLVKTIDLYASSNRWRQLVWQRSWSSVGTHTVQIRVVGTAGRPKIDMDGFAILATP